MAIEEKMVIEQSTNLETATTSNPAARPEAEAEVIDAIRRVYLHYGNNLSAFFEDVRQRRARTSEQFPLFRKVAKHS